LLQTEEIEAVRKPVSIAGAGKIHVTDVYSDGN
jgi:hypothetical protein